MKIFNKKSLVILSTFIAIFAYTIYLIFILNINNTESISDSIIWFTSLIGVLTYSYIIYIQKKLEGQYFSLYTIFVTLMFIFNFGQCLGWAFNIHLDDEIGNGVLFRYFEPNNMDIFIAQVNFLVSMILFNWFGCIFKKKKYKQNVSIDSRIILYKAARIISIIIVPSEFYLIISNYFVARTYGYGALYYGDIASSTGFLSSILGILNYAFFPCLIALLIGSNYKKNTRYFVYAVFGFYILITTLSGDRGGWFYPLLIFIWMHHTLYKRISSKKIVIFITISILCLNIINSIVSVRNTGINFESVLNSLNNRRENPVITSLFELGGTMGVNIIIIRDSIVYPFGNSYLLSMIGSLTSAVPNILGIEYVPLTRWFSQNYLNITWGAGFSIISELIINFGIILSPLLFGVSNIFIKKILDVDKKFPVIKSYIYISVSMCLMNMIRNTFHDFLRGVFFGIIPIIILYFIIQKSFTIKILSINREIKNEK